jgi:ketosteroid isomerase-like protein
VTAGNVEIVHAAYEQWARGDFSSSDWADPDFELVLRDGPAPATFKGLEAAAGGWAEFLSAFDHLQAVPEEVRAIDDERVLVLTKNIGRGKASGFELGDMQTRGANVIHVRGGRVTKLVAYFDRDLALADLEL